MANIAYGTLNKDSITLGRVEDAWRRAYEARDNGNQRFAEVGMRAANARDERLLLVLEWSAELITAHEEATRGQSRRTAENFAETKETTETQLWKEAYRLCDEGRPIENFMWVYGAAAYLCGYLL